MSVNNDENPRYRYSFLCGIFVIPKIKNIMYAIIVAIHIANKIKSLRNIPCNQAIFCASDRVVTYGKYEIP